ncbi:MAG: DUF5011 domain-containing protein [Pseudomonadales bacterium]|nr:DUF5011 domain-containing protein [Pseudomonadales bacterium]
MIATDVGASPGFTNSGESIVLFWWDGVSDLVSDVDMLNIGTPSATNDIRNKTSIMVDGPDADSVTSAYKADSYLMPQQLSDPGFGFSTKRISIESSKETSGGGNGITGDDETSEDITITWDNFFTEPAPGVCELTSINPSITINEVDADTEGSDTLEFVELYGEANTPLDGLVLVFIDIFDYDSYQAYDLDGQSLNADGFFVLGNAGVDNVDLVFSDNTLLNSNNALALFVGDATDFPNNTAVHDVGLIDALVYRTNNTAKINEQAVIDVLTPGQLPIDESAAGNGTFHSNARLPNGGVRRNTSTYVQQNPTPGASNLGFTPPSVLINEVDADTDGINILSFVELYGDPNASLDGLVIVFFNGSDDASYEAFDLDGQFLNADGFFVLGNAAVNNVDMVFDNDSLQNGADAVALFIGDAADFLNDTPVTNVGLIDALVYDTDDSDDNTLIDVLTPGQAQINERDAGNGTFHSNSRFPDGGLTRNTSTYVQQDPTPGVTNLGSTAPAVIINEVDADTPGTNTLSFVELYGEPNTPLDSLVIVFFNGSDDASYEAFDLDGLSLNAEGFFVLGNAAVLNVDLVFANNDLQNGADAVALFVGDATDFPNDTPVTETGLIDALVYDTGDNDDQGLIDVLTPAQAQIDERALDNSTGHSNSRIPDGGLTRNTSTYVQQTPTPGTSNFPPTSVLINEVDSDMSGSDTLEFIELYGTPLAPLDHLVVVLFNGSSDTSYKAFDLDGYSLNATGLFVLGNAAVNNVDLIFANDTMQNGPDAVAVFVADAADFPDGTFVTVTNLMDAIVYDSDDQDDTGLIDVLTPGQAQIDERTNGSQYSNARLPDGGVSLDTSTYVQQDPTPGTLNQFFSINQIQGSGLTSPFDGQLVLTKQNIVTAVGADGFAMQTSDVSSEKDSDPDTSEGIWVVTYITPSVAVGDAVEVSGTIKEYFAMTQIEAISVVVTSSGNSLPTPVLLDETYPSPNQPIDPLSFERLEGMLVQMSAIVNGPSQSFNSDPIAEAYIKAGDTLAFRETGIEFPGLPGFPIWDTNPEIFELDIDKLGLTNRSFNQGVKLDVSGIIGYEFGDYELWASNYTIIEEAPIQSGVRTPANGEMTVASLNMYRFFTSDSQYNIRRTKFVHYIADVLGHPDILAVQEVGSLVELNDLAADILADSGVVYTAQLIEGNDIGGINVGFLLRDNIIINAVTQLGVDEMFDFNNSTYLLNDRPPLLLEAAYIGNGSAFELAVMVVHGRSLNNVDDVNSGELVRQKRLEQSQFVAQKVQDFQSLNPTIPLVVVGDFNAFEFSDGYVDVVGQIQGLAVARDNLLSGPNLVSPPLVNQVLSLPANKRYSFNFAGSLQVLDHALTSAATTAWVRGFEFGHSNSAAPLIEQDNDSNALRSSDHDGFVLFLMTDFDGDNIPDDFDNCPFISNSNQTDSDFDNIGDVCEPDTDNDGVVDDNDSEPLDPFKCRNIDGDAFDDCASGTDNPLADGDYDADGLADDVDPDADNDGVSNEDELIAGSDPLDKNDTIDLIAPVLTVPANIVVDARDSLGAVKIQAEIVLFLSLATAADNVDGVLNNINNNAADLLALGDHVITFTAQDSSNNIGQAQANITVADLSKPDIFLQGDSSITIELGVLYVDEGVLALDNVDGDISQTVMIDSNVDSNTIGLYSVTYNVSDAVGNIADSVTRNVSVQDTFAPVVTSPDNITVAADNSAGTTADNVLIKTFLENASVMDADQISSFTNDAPLTFPIGSTLVTFSAIDSTGNAGQSQSIILVEDQTPPVIILEGSSFITLALDDTYNELGATATDNVDGDLSIFVQRSGTFDTSKIGIYMLSYDVSDMKGNPAEPQIRQLSVQDVEAPIVNVPLSIIIAAQDANGVDSTHQKVIDFLLSASATDAVDGDITPSNDAPAAFIIGKTTVLFEAIDSAGNKGFATAFITVEDQTAPNIILNGAADMVIALNETYVEAGASAIDLVDGVLDTQIIISGEVDTTKIAVYTITYQVSDSAGNSTTMYRNVTVQDQQAPVITAPIDSVFATVDANGLPIDDQQIVELFNTVSVVDDLDVDLVITHNAPLLLPMGVSVIEFRAEDAQGNVGLAQTVITIEDQQAPVIVLLGSAVDILKVRNNSDETYETYEASGATAMDNVDGDLTAQIQIVHNVNLTVVGEYTVEFTVSDTAGNSSTVTREVEVVYYLPILIEDPEAESPETEDENESSKSGGFASLWFLTVMLMLGVGLLFGRRDLGRVGRI